MAFVVTRRADLTLDKTRYDILLLDIEHSRLSSGRPHPPTSLLAMDANNEGRHGKYGLNDGEFGAPAIQGVRWANQSTIAFLAQIGETEFQAYSIDVKTRSLKQLTHSENPVVSFGVSRDLSRIVFAARINNAALKPGARSMVVGNAAISNVLFGQSDIHAQIPPRFQYFVAETSGGKSGRALGSSFTQEVPPDAKISPNGDWAILRVPVLDPQLERTWLRGYPAISKWFDQWNPRDDPLRYFSRSDSTAIFRLVAYELNDGRGQNVLDAPDDTSSGSASFGRTDQLWLDPRGSVILGGSFLPVSSDAVTPRESDTYIIEYWPQSGRWTRVARLDGELEAIQGNDDGDSFVITDNGRQRRFEVNRSGAWVEAKLSPSATNMIARVNLRVVESLNEPPIIVADGPGGVRTTLFELAPKFSTSQWGVVRPYSWMDQRGRQWNGGLILPSGETDIRALAGMGKKYALVIQTYGFSPDRFYLSGPNTNSTGFTSGFPGRALARENILVLALPWRPAVDRPAPVSMSADRSVVLEFFDGVNGAIDSLVRQGIVDRSRIGIIGFSMTGSYVNNLLTFTDAPIRAASIVDGVSSSLFAVTSTYGFSSNVTRMQMAANDAHPFGDSIAKWVRNDPSLSTHCVTAALRIEAFHGLNAYWDTYALLRMQYKPVEMIVMPFAGHNLSRPSERFLSLQGNVDWYRFWLKGERRNEVLSSLETQSSLDDQYTRWRQLRELADKQQRHPKCPPDRWRP